MRSLSSSARRGLAVVGLISALAGSATACAGIGASDSDACGKGSDGGNVSECIGVSDLSSKSGDAVIPRGTQVTVVCKDNGGGVGIVVPKGIINADMGKVEWKTKGGSNAIRGVTTSVLRGIPHNLPSCDSALKHA